MIIIEKIVFLFHFCCLLYLCCFNIFYKKRKHLCLLLQDDPIAHNFDQSVNVDSSGMKNNSEYHLEMSTWELYSKSDIFDGLQPIIRVNTQKFIQLIYITYIYNNINKNQIIYKNNDTNNIIT